MSILNFYNEGAFSIVFILIDFWLLWMPLMLRIIAYGYKSGIGKYKNLPIGHNEYHLPPYIRNSSSEIWDECLTMRVKFLRKASVPFLLIGLFLFIIGHVLTKFKVIMVIIKWIILLIEVVFITHTAIKINKHFRPKGYKLGWKDIVNK